MSVFIFFNENLNLDRIWTPARAAIFQERNFSPTGQPYPLVSVFMFFNENVNLKQIWAPARAAISQERNFSPTGQPYPLVSVFICFSKKLESQPYLGACARLNFSGARLFTNTLNRIPF